VAAGSEDDQAVFLDSTDGTAWHRQTEPGKGGPSDLAASPGRVVGVGVIDGRLASWTSPDGLTWQAHPKAFPRAPNGSGFDEDWVQVTDVVAADEGWLAVGRRDPACQVDCGLDPKRAYVWTSRDGASWTRVPDQKAFNAGGMDAVARGATGFVAAGVAGGRAAFWTSADGLKWSRVPDDALFHAPKDMGLTAIDVAADGGLLVAIGTFSSQDAARVRAWWSADGRTWTKASVEQPTDAVANGVTATPDGFLAPGWSVGCPGGSPVDPSSSHGAIWASNDGQTWRCDFPDVGPPGFIPSAAAASDSVEVAVGSTDPSDEDEESSPPRQGAIWYRTRP
jgi:hypothetical protein